MNPIFSTLAWTALTVSLSADQISICNVSEPVLRERMERVAPD
jgi:hypothetical protein